MTTQETVDKAAKMAGDRRAVLVARNIGDSAGNITILDGDGQESPTQFQNCDLDTASQSLFHKVFFVFQRSGY